MSESRNYERLPDRAALDELHRAFEQREPGDVEPAADEGDATVDRSGGEGAPGEGANGNDTPDWVDDDLSPGVEPGEGGADELLIVEQVPPAPLPVEDLPGDAAPPGTGSDPEPAPEPATARPTIVIGDADGLTGDDLAPADDPRGDAPDAAPRDADGPGAGGPATIEIDGTSVAEGEAADVAAPVDDRSVDGASIDGASIDGASDGDVSDACRPDAQAGPATIKIDDADLPDAVFIRGSLDADGQHSIVIIEDDDLDGAVDPDAGADSRRGIEPRLRERRVAVMRAQGRRRLRWILVASGAVVIVVGTLALLGSPLFSVRAEQVTVTGNVYTDAVELDALIDELVGTPTLRADTQDFERRIERIPWVESARVRIDFPRGASIEIREREAWSTYRGLDEQFRVLDDEGRVLAVIEGQPAAYVLLAGPDPVDLDPGEFAPRGFAVASELAKNLTSSVRGLVEAIEVSADGSELALVLNDGATRVRFGEARDLFAKLVRLETVLSGHSELPSGTIDVSTREVTVPDGAERDDSTEGADG